MATTGRGEGIRTPGPMLPKHVRYQTALHPGLFHPPSVIPAGDVTNHTRNMSFCQPLFQKKLSWFCNFSFFPAACRRSFPFGDHIDCYCLKEWCAIKDRLDERALLLAQYLTERQTTVRNAARAFGISKSTVHKDMLERLPKLDSMLSRQVAALMGYNKAVRHLRGGAATRRRYALRHARPGG